VQFIHSAESLLERHGMVWCVQVEDVYAVCSELFETSLEVLLQPVGLVNASLIWVHLGGEGKAAVLPSRLARPCLLLAANVHAGCVDFIVALGLEVVEMLGEVVEVCDASAGGLIGAWGVLVMVLAVDVRSLPNVISPRMTRSFGFCAMRGILAGYANYSSAM
jgi:hypothetical protein